MIRLAIVLGVVLGAVLWFAGLRLFLHSGLSLRRKLIWSAVLILMGGAIGVLLSIHALSVRFLILLCALPLLGLADVVLLHSSRGISFWVRACGFEVCTVFAAAAAVRLALDWRGIAPVLGAVR